MPDGPRFRRGQNLEEANIVRVKVRVDASCQEARLYTEIAHEHRDALMQGQGLSILDSILYR